MNYLSIDTTTKKATIAIKTITKLYTDSIENEITHSEKLLPLIHNSFSKSLLTLKDIDLFLVLNGPGSFTGIRIGIATIKAFAQVEKKSIFSISSLEALALKLYTDKKYTNKRYIASLINAKNNRVYFSLFEVTTLNEKLTSKCLIEYSNELIDDALDILKNQNIKNILFVLDNTILFENNIKNKFNTDCIYLTYPSPSDIIYFYENLFETNKYLFNTFTLDATYARMSQAERTKEDANEKI